MKKRIIIATTVAGLTFGVFAPLSSKANNAQISITHAEKSTKAKAAAVAAASDAKTPKFKVAVVATPHSQAPSQVNNANTKYIHR